MKPFGALISFEQASRIVQSSIQPLPRTEKLPLDACLGRVLAEDISALMSVPPFDRAAMDGYAVRAKDTFGAGQTHPRLLEVIGTIHAGQSSRSAVKAGAGIQVATGAMLPAGADAVVMVEDTESDGATVKVFRAVSPKANVAARGEDIKEGALILKEGSVLDPGKLGVIASQGIKLVSVYEKPRVAVLPTGEEVQETGKKLRRGQVYDINSHTVAAVVQANGGIPVRSGVVGDDRAALQSAISRALAENDLVVLSGGSSVGERDLLIGVLEEAGQVLFHGIQVKPGKPTLFGMVRNKPVMGMPGYPTSCLINAYLLLLPAVRQMAHLPPRARATVPARLARRVPGSVGRKQFLTVKIEDGAAYPLFKESGSITGIAEADGYIEIAENIDLLEKDSPVTVTLF